MAEELLLDKFIVNGVQHDFLPEVFTTLQNSGSMEAEPTETLNGKRIRVSRQTKISGYNPLAYARSMSMQFWNADWSCMDRRLYDQLLTLYTLDASFMIQFDDEMSRDILFEDETFGNDFARLLAFGHDNRTFLTPTYPIKPYGSTPFVPGNYEYSVFIDDGTTMYALQQGFVVDEEQGVILFDSKLATDIEVFMKYTWRAKVRIASFDLMPLEEVAQSAYTGSIVFEQLALSGKEYVPWINSYTSSVCELQADETFPTADVEIEVPVDFEYPTDGTGGNGDPDNTDVCNDTPGDWTISTTWDGTTTYYDPVTDSTTATAWLADGSTTPLAYVSASAVDSNAAYAIIDGTITFDFSFIGLGDEPTIVNAETIFNMTASAYGQVVDQANQFFVSASTFLNVEAGSSPIVSPGIEPNFSFGTEDTLSNGDVSVNKVFLPTDASQTTTYSNTKTYTLAYELGASIIFNIYGRINISVGQEPGLIGMTFTPTITTTIYECGTDYDDAGSDGSGGNNTKNTVGVDLDYVDAVE